MIVIMKEREITNGTKFEHIYILGITDEPEELIEMAKKDEDPTHGYKYEIVEEDNCLVSSRVLH